MKTNKTLEDTLIKMASQGLIIPRVEKNPYLKLSYKGAGGLITPKWNIKIYTSGSFVCTDTALIREFYHGWLKVPDKKLQVLQIDDAGWGIPLCGIMVGVCDGRKIITDIVDVAFFKSGIFERQDYLLEYSNKGLNIVENQFKANPETHRIEICTGFINSKLKNLLRSKGYHVTITEIKGMLQDQLEDLFKKYVLKETGMDLAYDPKGMSKKEISLNYYKALEWGKKNVPHLLKSGWKSMQDLDL